MQIHSVISERKHSACHKSVRPFLRNVSRYNFRLSNDSVRRLTSVPSASQHSEAPSVGDAIKSQGEGMECSFVRGQGSEGE
jgi:hypothetical protein